MKICSKCKVPKSIEEFSRDKSAPSGRRYQCKTCSEDYQRRYQQSEVGKAARAAVDKKHNQTAAGKATRRRGVEKWNRKNPEKRRANQILQNAVCYGKILKPDVCSSCNKGGIIHGHHEDYSKPLEVDWLCVQCHKDLHKSLMLRKVEVEQAVMV